MVAAASVAQGDRHRGRAGTRGECGALPVFIHERGTERQIFTSYWKPSAEDLAKLNAGEHVRLDVWSLHPPVWLSVDKCAELP